LVNLISNAMKFTQEGSVLVRVLPWETRGLRFEVIDTGDGLSDEASAKMFMPFIETPHDKANYQGGTGLGLYICKLLSDLMVRILPLFLSQGSAQRGVRSGVVFSPGASAKMFLPFLESSLTRPITGGGQGWGSTSGTASSW
jgi:hypothetical protein